MSHTHGRERRQAHGCQDKRASRWKSDQPSPLSRLREQSRKLNDINLSEVNSFSVVTSREHDQHLDSDHQLVGKLRSLSQDADVSRNRSPNKPSCESLHSLCTTSTNTSQSSLRDFSCPPSTLSTTSCLSTVRPHQGQPGRTQSEDIHQLETKFHRLGLNSILTTENCNTRHCPADHTNPQDHYSNSRTNEAGRPTTSQGTGLQPIQRSNHNKPPSDDRDDDEDDDHHDKRRKDDSLTSGHSKHGVQRGYACPLAKRFPEEHGSCNRFQKFYDVARVKQHLDRNHLSLFCDICHKLVGDDKKLREAHANDNSCIKSTLTKNREGPATYKSRSKRKRPQDDAWFSLYKILFPGATLPENPFVEMPCFEPSDCVSLLRFVLDNYPDFKLKLENARGSIDEGTRFRAVQWVRSLPITNANDASSYLEADTPAAPKITNRHEHLNGGLSETNSVARGMSWKGMPTMRKSHEDRCIANPTSSRRARNGILGTFETSQMSSHAQSLKTSYEFFGQMSIPSNVTTSQAGWSAADRHGALPTPPFQDPPTSSSTQFFIDSLQDTHHTSTSTNILYDAQTSVVRSDKHNSATNNGMTQFLSGDPNHHITPDEHLTHGDHSTARKATTNQTRTNSFQFPRHASHQPYPNQRSGLQGQSAHSTQPLHPQSTGPSPHSLSGQSRYQSSSYDTAYHVSSNQGPPYSGQYIPHHP